MEEIIIIPARLKSKRLPRKPLLLINNKPMIIMTAQNAIQAVGSEKVFVATDSEEIMACCKKYKVNSILTSDNCLTGTDRVIEAAGKLNAKFVYNLQGDEPLFPKEIIISFLEQTKNSPYATDIGVTEIIDKYELNSPKIPKIVFNINKELLYTSRSKIPGSKKMNSKIGFKQVCIYRYSIEKLKEYREYKNKTFFEDIEDLELLRMVELGIKVKCIFLNYKEHMSVDTKEDLEKVRNKFKK